jgi:hypothetical protein
MKLWQMDVMGGVMLEDGTEMKVVTRIDDHSRFCVIARLVERATARPVCDALSEGLSRHGVPSQILTDNGKVFPGRLARKPAQVLFDRICLNNGIRHILTAPYSPTTTGKIERLHKTIRKEFLQERSFSSISHAQDELDRWVAHYNLEREHQAIGDVAPIRRFELATTTPTEVIDPDASSEISAPRSRAVGRRVDRAGRISILKHRYHVGRYLAGQSVSVESIDGLLHVSHNGVLVATHARRHLAEDDDKMDRRAKASRPRRPTTGGEVLRKVDPTGAVSFAGTSYRACNRYISHIVGVRLVADTVQITQLATTRARSSEHCLSPTGNPGGSMWQVPEPS